MLKDESSLNGWSEICDYMKIKTRKTAIEIVIEYNAPIIKLGGRVFATKERLDKWLDHLFEKETYSALKKREKRALKGIKKEREETNENKS